MSESDINRVLRELADSQHEVAALRAERDRLAGSLRMIQQLAISPGVSNAHRLRAISSEVDAALEEREGTPKTEKCCDCGGNGSRIYAPFQKATKCDVCDGTGQLEVEP